MRLPSCEMNAEFTPGMMDWWSLPNVKSEVWSWQMHLEQIMRVPLQCKEIRSDEVAIMWDESWMRWLPMRDECGWLWVINIFAEHGPLENYVTDESAVDESDSCNNLRATLSDSHSGTSSNWEDIICWRLCSLSAKIHHWVDEITPTPQVWAWGE